MELKCELTLPERIIAVQKQLKIAIQNHHIMHQRKQLLQNRDEKIRPHLEIIQFIIINIGRTQASLLNQYRNEIAAKYNLKPNNLTVTNIMKSNLLFNDTPKSIPIYKQTSPGGNENKKLKTKMKSVLKVNNKEFNEIDKIKIGSSKANEPSIDGSNIKIMLKKEKESCFVMLSKPKKHQSVLKSKCVQQKSEKISDEGNQSPLSVSSLSSTDSRSKDTSPRSFSPIEEIDLTYSPPPPNKVDTRYGRKYEAKTFGASKNKGASIPDQSSSNKRGSHEFDPHDQEEWVPFPTVVAPPRPSSRLLMRKLDGNPESLNDLDQESYLSMFNLVSRQKCEMLKRKRCERKRRSVAGQNSLYSDYLQPQPKRTYTPRKHAASVVAPNTNAVIVESSVPDDDDEDKEKPVCFVCHDGGDYSVMESCYGCNESFHSTCLSPTQKDICPSPNCTAQRTISNIVGANISSGNASDVELVKRYLNEDSTSDVKSGVVKQSAGTGEAEKQK